MKSNQLGIKFRNYKIQNKCKENKRQIIKKIKAEINVTEKKKTEELNKAKTGSLKKLIKQEKF